eukprot:14344340-Alexandrium_andersonii.AAC.1
MVWVDGDTPPACPGAEDVLDMEEPGAPRPTEADGGEGSGGPPALARGDWPSGDFDERRERELAEWALRRARACG